MNDEMQDILNDFLAESSEMLEALDQHFVKLETEPTNAELLNEIFRCMHSMKGSAGFLGFTHLVEVVHQGESLLNNLRQGEMSVSPFIIDIILEAVDAVKLLLADIRETGEDSHVETALIVNKLTLTMDSADDLKDIMPAASVVASAFPVATEPSEETTVSLGVVATETAGVDVAKPEKQEVPVDPPSATEASAAVLDSTPDLSEVLAEMQEGASHTVQATSFDPTKASGKEEDSTGCVEKNPEGVVHATLGQEENSIVIRIEGDGRGFAVVADEIHKLVEQTTKATKEMGAMVRQIQQDIKNVVSSRDQGTNQVCQGVEPANKTGEAISKIQAMANEMVVMIQHIAGAAEEQSNATQQIAGDLEAMTQTTRRTISGVADSAQSCHQLITLANDLRKTVSAFKV